MGIKQNYKTVRDWTWVYYVIALVFFVLACQAFPTSQNPDGSMMSFVWWVALATGTAFGAGRNKRAAADKLAEQHRAG